MKKIQSGKSASACHRNVRTPNITTVSENGLLGAVKVYEKILYIAFALSALPLIFYLQAFQSTNAKFHSHAFHEIAIGIAILISAAVTYVSALCYRSSGEVLLRWLTLSLLAFTVIYAPHGIFTRLAADNPPLFLLYGPASRMAMAGLMFIGFLNQASPPDSQERRASLKTWISWLLGFVAFDTLIAWIALNPQMINPASARIVMEGSAIAFFVGALLAYFKHGSRSPLLLVFAIAFCFFSQSSLSFFLASPWNHQWWLAHAIFATGFTLISFGLARSFLTTRQLVEVFSVDDWMQEVLQANERANDAIHKMHVANEKLEVLANTDGLTGLWNRRHFFEVATGALKNVDMGSQPVSLMIIDLDHFKLINDTCGHDKGDEVLIAFTTMVKHALRQHIDPQRTRNLDLLGRIGGEEFAVVLPNTDIRLAKIAAERIRIGCKSIRILDANGDQIQLSTSIGIAQASKDQRELKDLLQVADQRLYLAKRNGRDQIQAA